MKALILTPSSRTTEVRDIPAPTPGPGEVLIRVHAVALNPVDALYVQEPVAEQQQRVVGTDFAGIVVGASDELRGVADGRVQNGTRVAGFLQGASSANDRPGAFAEYATAPYDLLWTIPEGLSFEEAATISMCGLTAAQGIFDRFGLPGPFSAGQIVPSDDPINVLVYGSSTSLGQLAAQLVHRVGEASGRSIRLIGVASSSKHEFLRGAPYKYDYLVDYREQDWPEQVRRATGDNGVHFALDTISERDTVAKVHSTLNPQGKYHVFRSARGGGFDTANLAIQPIYGAVWEGLGVGIGYGHGVFFPAKPEAREFAAKFFDFLNSGAKENDVKLHPNPIRRMPGGLERIVPDGFALLTGLVIDRKGFGRTEDYMRPISAEKLVYTIE
ncbi:zinc-binding oxidoreductase [Pochonia chlamydosporia 170]|uniref:Zinc-binding oxidoreductase n=1 Tax=Pochonia chlamydosporia 170 TaxID=1380566 RepID=A0A219ASF9_METCM|nr:zinc-binding oxidoreductase [Pochonia chlamydosporia 170]OWT43224.1 zinc-binding oxidoreductase [Pochonia chlamydosporia 170]